MDECENVVLTSWPDIELDALERILTDLDATIDCNVTCSPKTILRAPPIHPNETITQLQYLPRSIPEQKRSHCTEEAVTVRKLIGQIKELTEDMATLKEQIKIKDDQIVTLFYSHRHKITKLEEIIYNKKT